MKRITINFKPEKFEEELEKLKEMIINTYYTSYDFNRDKHFVDLYIGGELIMIFADSLDDGITLSIYSDISYYDKEEQKIKHITENIRTKGITSYIIS